MDTIRFAVLVAIVAATLAVHGQENCSPPAEAELHWSGLTSDCSESNGVPCETGEIIVFSVVPKGGGSYPSCVTYHWSFGDDTTDSTLPSPSHVYVSVGTFFVLVQVTGGGVTQFAGAPMVITPATVVPIIESFTASAPVVRRGQTLVLSWSVKNATSVRIDPINVTLTTATSYSFVPTATRTYTLTAFGAAAFRVSTPVTVVVSNGRQRAVRH